MKYSLYLGRISGIRISVHWTFMLLIIWIIYSGVTSGWNVAEISWYIVFVLVIFGCIVLHELGHALAARRYQIKTRDITILPIGGVAHLESIPEKPKEELVVALAGPLVNVAIVAILLPFVSIPDSIDEMDSVGPIGTENFLMKVVGVNVLLAVFNMIPAFPMDGGRVLRALLGFKLPHPKATRIAASIGQILAMAFLVYGFYSFNPFLIIIGFFIFVGAQQEAVYSRSKSLLEGYTVNDVLMDEVPLIDEHAQLKEVASRLVHTDHKNFVVTRDGKAVGILTRDEIIKGLRDHGENAPLQEVKDSEMTVLSRDMPLEEAWNIMRQKGKSAMAVMTNGQLDGIVDAENVAEFVMIRTEAVKPIGRSG